MSHFLINSLTALVMGTLIGLERQWGRHPAGLRTNALVSLGAAMFVALAPLMGDVGAPSRVASTVVSGLGFLGGGVILREGLTVRGLNTAATIWCTGAVGSLAGGGFLWQSFAGTVAILAVHLILRPLSDRIDIARKTAVNIETSYRLRVCCQHGQVTAIRALVLRDVIAKEHMDIQRLTTDETNPAAPIVVAEICSLKHGDHAMEEVVALVSAEPGVSEVSWSRI
jgi:putative Mg2+ transporter-C (MgtC) family protein